MNTPIFKNNRVYLYHDYQEIQEINNHIINRRAEKMESLIEKIITGIAWTIAIVLGVGFVPILLNVLVGGGY